MVAGAGTNASAVNTTAIPRSTTAASRARHRFPIASSRSLTVVVGMARA